MERLLNSADLYRVLSAEEFKLSLDQAIGQAEGVPSARELALFRRRELLRILIRDVLGHDSLTETVEELSNLADAILDGAYRRIRASLELRFGKPCCVGVSGNAEEAGFSVIALGKLGGRELNYSSDIDLLFLYGSNGETDGKESISNKEFFKRVANS
jgi:glutamate-ammonia-ligase adenylyltransferase